MDEITYDELFGNRHEELLALTPLDEDPGVSQLLSASWLDGVR